MDLGAKLRLLRDHAGQRRGLGRPMSQSEVARTIRADLGGSISQSYLSQLERGQRQHMTQKSREQLARFFQVHPGFLVSDPEDIDPLSGHHGLSELARHAPGIGPWVTGPAPAHHTLARLAVHPRGQQIWRMVERLIDLPDEEFSQLHAALGIAAPEIGAI